MDAGASWGPRDAGASTEAVCRVAGASGLLGWGSDRCTLSSGGWDRSPETIEQIAAALEGVSGPSMLDPSGAASALLRRACADERAEFLYVPIASVSPEAGLVLRFEGGKGAAPGLDLDAFGRVAADALRVYLDRQVAVSTAQLATAGQMAIGIAHDVGTPLNVISGYAEYLLMGTAQDGAGRKELETILDQTRRVAQMVRQMLDIVRPIGNQPRSRQPLDQFTTTMLQASMYMLRKAEVKAQVEQREVGATVVVGDMPRLHQVFFNLFGAAAHVVGPNGRLFVRAVVDDSGAPGVEIEGRSSAGQPVDLGPVLEPGARARACDLLGLTLAERVLEEHGGGLELLSETTPGIPAGGAGTTGDPSEAAPETASESHAKAAPAARTLLARLSAAIE